jgi:hypothetical protein
MTVSYPAVVENIKQLTLEEQLTLLETLSRLIRGTLRQEAKPTDSRANLRGILKPDGVLPPEEELTDAYTQYLIEKYK